MSYGPQTIFNMFNNADLRFPSIDDGNGGQIEITHGRFISLMESKNRQVRKDAFMGLYHTYASFRNTLAAAYSANVKKKNSLHQSPEICLHYGSPSGCP